LGRGNLQIFFFIGFKTLFGLVRLFSQFSVGTISQIFFRDPFSGSSDIARTVRAADPFKTGWQTLSGRYLHFSSGTTSLT
jgi:hypothetical protein